MFLPIRSSPSRKLTSHNFFPKELGPRPYCCIHFTSYYLVEGSSIIIVDERLAFSLPSPKKDA